MQLEEYFDFLAPNDIRLRGHRIGIESILDEYLASGRSPEEIREQFPTLTLEQIYATILYYLHNQESVSAYMGGWIEQGERHWVKQWENPDPVLVRLRELKRQQRSVGSAAQ